MKIALSILMLSALVASCAPRKDYFSDAKVIGPYTPAIKAGRTLYISGQIALKPGTTELANNTIETEAGQVMENLAGLLKKAGYGTADLVQCTVYLKDINDYAAMNRIYGSYFEQGRAPARTTVEVSSLPRNARIEISAVACK